MFEGEHLPFFQTSPFKVRNRIESTKDGREPEVEIDDELSFVCIMAAKNGFYGGNPDEVAEAPVTTVLNILRYQKFEADMKMTSLELARDALGN